MEQILQNIQTILKEKFAYVDENWGQLNLPNPPVKYPCALIDCDNANFSNLVNDHRQQPTLRQEGLINIEITIATLKLTNTSAHAPQTQRDKAWLIYELIQEAHKLLQGQMVGNGKLVRTAQRRIRRADGMQEHRIIYTLAAHDI
ncbi:hypothetical protein QP519_11415 [Weeksella virosa]|uniref:hypothetical protein n=1 Tax=Weeksella virosa TaxID=1014 RepID=UPI002553D90D|nr:hypothetical protein [Weeksella virosa]MDK7376140.1 hypothetical protein [Weeksella virosa]MDK7674376.1 hypothetical protein [Weeksella virosa]